LNAADSAARTMVRPVAGSIAMPWFRSRPTRAMRRSIANGVEYFSNRRVLSVPHREQAFRF
jgi:hypothetical protein